jgi:type II secretory pathway component PulC
MRSVSWSLRLGPLALAALTVAGCGAAPPRATAASAEPAPASAEPAVEAPTPIHREGVIPRAELDTVLAGGLGRFLQGVATEPHLEEGRFVGFRLTALQAPYFAGLDLRAGDTVLTVNGLPIERPEQALAAWDGLRVASELTLEYLRSGERQQLRFAIED